MKTLTGLNAAKYILDPVHGMIPITDIELQVISTPPFQRLRGITQLGLASMVYPGATHNRFQHSLGTLHIMDKLLYTLVQEDNFNLKEPQRTRVIQKMRIAALLHDCGHLPFSHIFEKYRTNRKHEFFSDRIIQKSEIGQVLEQNKIKPASIGILIDEGLPTEDEDSGILMKMLPLLHSDADADRMDYLLRDAYFTGVPFGKIDLDRICSFITLNKDKLCYSAKAQDSLENFLYSRFQMYRKVYTHKTVNCYDLILRRIYDLFDNYRSKIPIPFSLPSEADFERCDENWFSEEFCRLTEASFFESIAIFLKNKQKLSTADSEKLQNLNRSLCSRIAIKLSYKKDVLALKPMSDGLDRKKRGEYCEKEKAVFTELNEQHSGIVNHWSFLRLNPDKPLEIATAIDADYDDEQDFKQIRILTEDNAGNSEQKLLQEIMGEFIRSLATHHRVLILYYHNDSHSRAVINEIANRVIDK